MKITDYISQIGNDTKISRATGLDRTTISRIRRGIIDPPLSTAEHIVTMTGGTVAIVLPSRDSELPQVASAHQ